MTTVEVVTVIREDGEVDYVYAEDLPGLCTVNQLTEVDREVCHALQRAGDAEGKFTAIFQHPHCNTVT